MLCERFNPLEAGNGPLPSRAPSEDWVKRDSWLGVLKFITSVFVSFEIPAVKLNELLENFYVTVKKSDGSDFLATSLHAIRRGLDRILKNAGVGFSITSSTFSSSTKKLKEKLWVLSKAGMSGARSRNIVYFSLSDEEEMWQAGCLGDDSPITLLSTVVKYNSQYLNMRTLQEHADLMYGDIELLKDPQNQPYFARTDSVKRESRSGSTRVCHGKIYHEHSRGHKQCPYCLLYKYMYIHRPPTQMDAKSPFYLTARKEATDMGNVWYEEQRMGLRSLRGIVPNLARKVKLDNCENFTFVSFTQVSRRLSSHSCCQWTLQGQATVPPTHVGDFPHVAMARVISKQVLRQQRMTSSLRDPAGLHYCSRPFLRLEIHFYIKVDDWIIWMFYLNVWHLVKS